MPKRYILITILALLLGGLVLANTAWAFDIKDGIVGNLSASCRVDGNCTWCDFIDLFVVLQKVILSLFGGLALIMIIWGGTGILTSAGNTQKVAEGKKLILSTIFGVLIILAGYFLIVVTVFVFAGPRDLNTGKPLPITGMFAGESWKLAFCPSSNSASFCRDRGNGTPCTVTSGSYTGAGICKGGACVTNCENEWGSQGYTCRDSSSCTVVAIIGLCPGNSNWVCCK